MATISWAYQSSAPEIPIYTAPFSGGGANTFSMRSAASTSSSSSGGGSAKFTTSPSQYLSIPNSTSFTQNNAFTYEFWYYPTSTNAGYLVAMLQHNWITIKWGAAGAGTIGLDMSYVGNAPGYTPQNRVYAINNWYHIALSWDNNSHGYLFMNGVIECTFTGAGGTVGDGNPLLIGQYQSVGQPTPFGYITNFRFVKGVAVYTGTFTPPTSALTLTQSSGTNISAITSGQTQILLLATDSGGLVTDAAGNFTVTNYGSVVWDALTPFSSVVTAGLFFHLDAGNTSSYPGSGTTWTDLVSGVTTTLINGPTYNSANGGYINFVQSSTQYAQTTTALSVLTRFTVEVWHYYNGTYSTGQPCIVSQIFASGVINYFLGSLNVTPPNLKFGFFSGAWNVTSSTYTLPATGWYHIVGTYDGSVINLYVNTSLVGTYSTTDTPSSSGSALRLMARWDNLDCWGGRLAVVRIYNGALNTTQIGTNYNASKTRFGLS